MSYTITESCSGCTACTHKCPVHAIGGERKQKHQIDPLLCIECGACGKICPNRAVQDQNGRFAERLKPDQWQKPVWNYRNCVECRICVMACPTGAIHLIGHLEKQNGLRPSSPFLQDAKACIGCGFCAASCPTSAIQLKTPSSQVKPAQESASQ